MEQFVQANYVFIRKSYFKILLAYVLPFEVSKYAKLIQAYNGNFRQ